MTISRIVLGAVSLIGAGGIGLFGANEATKKTISDGLGKRKIPKLEDVSFSGSIWLNMFDKLTGTSGEKISPQTDHFINFDTTYDRDLYPPNELEKLCQKVSKETYSTIFKTNQKLMDDVKSFCTIDIETATTILIGSLLKTSEGEREASKESFKKHLSTLKSSDEDLVDSLKEVKRIVSEKKKIEENDWKELASWCDESYKLSFSSEKDPLWLQVVKYCKAPNKGGTW